MDHAAPWQPPTRAVYDAVRVPGCTAPLDTVHLRIDFPAAQLDPEADPRLGVIGPDLARTPLPVVLLAGNFNCPPSLYQWLATRLALRGMAVVTWTFVADLFQGRPGLSTGIDLAAFAPDSQGQHPSPMLAAILQRLAVTPELGEGDLDLSRIVLGGHSAGGTWALLSSAAVDGVLGAFSYGGHTRTQVAQGFGTGNYLSLPGLCPSLLLYGERDEVVNAIAAAQGQAMDEHPMHRTAATAAEGVDVRLVEIAGANHYSMCQGYDGSTGRGYLEPRVDDGAAREEIGRRIEDFCVEVLELSGPRC